MRIVFAFLCVLVKFSNLMKLRSYTVRVCLRACACVQARRFRRTSQLERCLYVSACAFLQCKKRNTLTQNETNGILLAALLFYME